jgi:hypothetical protein
VEDMLIPLSFVLNVVQGSNDSLHQHKGVTS